MKIRVLGGFIGRSDRFVIEVDERRTTFAEMYPLIEAERVRRGSLSSSDDNGAAIVVSPDNYELVQLEEVQGSSGKTMKPLQTLPLDGTAESVHMHNCAMMLRRIPNKGISLLSSSSALSGTFSNEKHRVRVLGGPILKSDRVFISFEDENGVMLAVKVFEKVAAVLPKSVDPPISEAHYELWELREGSDGKVKPHRMYFKLDPVDVDKLPYPALMLKVKPDSALQSGIATPAARGGVGNLSSASFLTTASPQTFNASASFGQLELSGGIGSFDESPTAQVVAAAPTQAPTPGGELTPPKEKSPPQPKRGSSFFKTMAAAVLGAKRANSFFGTDASTEDEGTAPSVSSPQRPVDEKTASPVAGSPAVRQSSELEEPTKDASATAAVLTSAPAVTPAPRPVVRTFLDEVTFRLTVDLFLSSLLASLEYQQAPRPVKHSSVMITVTPNMTFEAILNLLALQISDPEVRTLLRGEENSNEGVALAVCHLFTSESDAVAGNNSRELQNLEVLTPFAASLPAPNVYLRVDAKMESSTLISSPSSFRLGQRSSRVVSVVTPRQGDHLADAQSSGFAFEVYSRAPLSTSVSPPPAVSFSFKIRQSNAVFTEVHDLVQSDTTSFTHRVAVQRILEKAERRTKLQPFLDMTRQAIDPSRQEPEISKTTKLAALKGHVRRVLECLQSSIITPYSPLATGNSPQALAEQWCSVHATRQDVVANLFESIKIMQQRKVDLWLLTNREEPTLRVVECVATELLTREKMQWKFIQSTQKLARFELQRRAVFSRERLQRHLLRRGGMRERQVIFEEFHRALDYWEEDQEWHLIALSSVVSHEEAAREDLSGDIWSELFLLQDNFSLRLQKLQQSHFMGVVALDFYSVEAQARGTLQREWEFAGLMLRLSFEQFVSRHAVTELQDLEWSVIELYALHSRWRKRTIDKEVTPFYRMANVQQQQLLASCEQSHRAALRDESKLQYEGIVGDFFAWIREREELRFQLDRMDVYKEERIVRKALLDEEQVDAHILFNVAEDSLLMFWAKYQERRVLEDKEAGKRAMWERKNTELRNVWRAMFSMMIHETSDHKRIVKEEFTRRRWVDVYQDDVLGRIAVMKEELKDRQHLQNLKAMFLRSIECFVMDQVSQQEQRLIADEEENGRREIASYSDVPWNGWSHQFDLLYLESRWRGIIKTDELGARGYLLVFSTELKGRTSVFDAYRKQLALIGDAFHGATLELVAAASAKAKQRQRLQALELKATLRVIGGPVPRAERFTVDVNQDASIRSIKEYAFRKLLPLWLESAQRKGTSTAPYDYDVAVNDGNGNSVVVGDDLGPFAVFPTSVMLVPVTQRRTSVVLPPKVEHSLPPVTSAAGPPPPAPNEDKKKLESEFPPLIIAESMNMASSPTSKKSTVLRAKGAVTEQPQSSPVRQSKAVGSSGAESSSPTNLQRKPSLPAVFKAPDVGKGLLLERSPSSTRLEQISFRVIGPALPPKQNILVRIAVHLPILPFLFSTLETQYSIHLGERSRYNVIPVMIQGKRAVPIGKPVAEGETCTTRGAEFAVGGILLIAQLREGQLPPPASGVVSQPSPSGASSSDHGRREEPTSSSSKPLDSLTAKYAKYDDEPTFERQPPLDEKSPAPIASNMVEVEQVLAVQCNTEGTTSDGENKRREVEDDYEAMFTRLEKSSSSKGDQQAMSSYFTSIPDFDEAPVMKLMSPSQFDIPLGFVGDPVAPAANDHLVTITTNPEQTKCAANTSPQTITAVVDAPTLGSVHIESSLPNTLVLPSHSLEIARSTPRPLQVDHIALTQRNAKSPRTASAAEVATSRSDGEARTSPRPTPMKDQPLPTTEQPQESGEKATDSIGSESVRIIGNPIPKAARFFVDVPTTSTIREILMTALQRLDVVKLEILGVGVEAPTPDEVSLSEVVLSEGSPKPSFISTIGREDVLLSEISSRVFALKKRPQTMQQNATSALAVTKFLAGKHLPEHTDMVMVRAPAACDNINTGKAEEGGDAALSEAEPMVDPAATALTPPPDENKVPILTSPPSEGSVIIEPNVVASTVPLESVPSSAPPTPPPSTVIPQTPVQTAAESSNAPTLTNTTTAPLMPDVVKQPSHAGEAPSVARSAASPQVTASPQKPVPSSVPLRFVVEGRTIGLTSCSTAASVGAVLSSLEPRVRPFQLLKEFVVRDGNLLIDPTRGEDDFKQLPIAHHTIVKELLDRAPSAQFPSLFWILESKQAASVPSGGGDEDMYDLSESPTVFCVDVLSDAPWLHQLHITISPSADTSVRNLLSIIHQKAVKHVAFPGATATGSSSGNYKDVIREVCEGNFDVVVQRCLAEQATMAPFASAPSRPSDDHLAHQDELMSMTLESALPPATAPHRLARLLLFAKKPKAPIAAPSSSPLKRSSSILDRFKQQLFGSPDNDATNARGAEDHTGDSVSRSGSGEKHDGDEVSTTKRMSIFDVARNALRSFSTSPDRKGVTIVEPSDDEGTNNHLNSNGDSLAFQYNGAANGTDRDDVEHSAVPVTIRVLGGPIEASLKITISPLSFEPFHSLFAYVRNALCEVGQGTVALEVTRERFDLHLVKRQSNGKARAESDPVDLSKRLADVGLAQGSHVLMLRERKSAISEGDAMMYSSSTAGLNPAAGQQASAGVAAAVNVRLVADFIPKGQRVYFPLPSPNLTYAYWFPIIEEAIRKTLPGIQPITPETFELLEVAVNPNGKSKIGRSVPLDQTYDMDPLGSLVLSIRKRPTPISLTRTTSNANNDDDMIGIGATVNLDDLPQMIEPTMSSSPTVRFKDENNNDAAGSKSKVIIRVIGHSIPPAAKVFVELYGWMSFSAIFASVQTKLKELGLPPPAEDFGPNDYNMHSMRLDGAGMLVPIRAISEHEEVQNCLDVKVVMVTRKEALPLPFDSTSNNDDHSHNSVEEALSSPSSFARRRGAPGKADPEQQPSPKNTRTFRIRVVGRPVPSDARLLIEVTPSTPFHQMFALVNEALQNILPGSERVASDRFSLVEMEVTASGRLQRKQLLELQSTPFLSDFGMSMSVIQLERVQGAALGQTAAAKETDEVDTFVPLRTTQRSLSGVALTRSAEEDLAPVVVVASDYRSSPGGSRPKVGTLSDLEGFQPMDEDFNAGCASTATGALTASHQRPTRVVDEPRVVAAAKPKGASLLEKPPTWEDDDDMSDGDEDARALALPAPPPTNAVDDSLPLAAPTELTTDDNDFEPMVIEEDDIEGDRRMLGMAGRHADGDGEYNTAAVANGSKGRARARDDANGDDCVERSLFHVPVEASAEVTDLPMIADVDVGSVVFASQDEALPEVTTTRAMKARQVSVRQEDRDALVVGSSERNNSTFTPLRRLRQSQLYGDVEQPMVTSLEYDNRMSSPLLHQQLRPLNSSNGFRHMQRLTDSIDAPLSLNGTFNGSRGDISGLLHEADVVKVDGPETLVINNPPPLTLMRKYPLVDSDAEDESEEATILRYTAALQSPPQQSTGTIALASVPDMQDQRRVLKDLERKLQEPLPQIRSVGTSKAPMTAVKGVSTAATVLPSPVGTTYGGNTAKVQLPPISSPPNVKQSFDPPSFVGESYDDFLDDDDVAELDALKRHLLGDIQRRAEDNSAKPTQRSSNQKDWRGVSGVAMDPNLRSIKDTLMGRLTPPSSNAAPPAAFKNSPLASRLNMYAVDMTRTPQPARSTSQLSPLQKVPKSDSKVHRPTQDVPIGLDGLEGLEVSSRQRLAALLGMSQQQSKVSFAQMLRTGPSASQSGTQYK